jgi:HEPN domain-containing protein
MKGYRSDYDILVIVNTRKLASAEYWHTATDRLMHDKAVETPVGLIAHSLREMNRFLQDGHYFFSDIRRDGIVLYELDDAALAEPKTLNAADAFRLAKEHFESRFSAASGFLDTASYSISRDRRSEAAFLLHQSLEQAYATILLVLTNYSPPSHNIKFLRSLAEGCEQRLVEAWPRDANRAVAWFNILNEAYVKARYSRHYEISEEALHWLVERTTILLELEQAACIERLGALADQVADTIASQDAAQ